MPTYHCVGPAGQLTDDVRAPVAAETARVHSKVTGAAGFFVQTYFTETAPHSHFLGGRLLDAPHLYVHGFVRSGRAPDVLASLVTELLTAISAVTGIAERSVWVYVSEIPGPQVAEWGHLLPHPGGEQAWMDSLPSEDRAAIDQLAGR